MKIERDKGFITNSIANNQGEYLIEIRSCGLSNMDFSYIKLNGTELFRTTSVGFTLVRFNEDMQYVSRQHIQNNSNAEAVIIQWFNSLLIGEKFAIITCSNHIFIPYITNHLGSTLHNKINRSHHLGDRTPWSAFGVKQNNVAYITHECVGSTSTGHVSPHAYLSITASRDNRITNYSSGSELNLSQQQQLINNTVGVKSGSIPINSVPFNGFIEFSIIGSMDNKSNVDSRICEFSIYKNNVYQTSIVISSDIDKVYKTQIAANTNDNVELRYLIPTNAFCTINYIGAHFKRYFRDDSLLAKSRINRRILATKHFKNSMIPCDPRNIEDVLKLNYRSLLPTDSNRFLDNMLFHTTNLTPSIIEGDFIELSEVSDALLLYIKSTLLTGSYLNLTLKFYDEHFNQVNILKSGITTTNVEVNTPITFKTKVLSIPIYRTNSTQVYDLGAFDLNSESKFFIRINDNVRYIKCFISGVNAHCLGILTPISFGIKNDGTTFGGLNIQA